MKKSLLFPIIVFVLGFQTVDAQNLNQVLDKLSKQYNFSFEEIKSDTFFIQKFVLNVKQAIDHQNPENGTFDQRVFLSHYDYKSPTVFITEGYGAYYAANPRYINELSDLLNANQVCVEHRYFGKSVPTPIEWQHLTVYNAASDHHKIIEILKEIYSGKWINTGISKGGQTAMYHRYHYPEDVDATVAYVCPLNFSIEDKRVYRFLESVRDSTSRKKVYDYQYEMLKNRTKYLPAFEELANKNELTFLMGISKAYELTVLEYSFAFFQWGNIPIDSIPSASSSIDIQIQHLNNVAGINWISEEGIAGLQPFFYQALKEIGFYGYDISPFKDVVSFKENPVFDFASPEGITVIYDPVPMQKVDEFIRHKATNMIFIYGESDPWSSTAVDLTYNNNLVKIVKPGGNHSTRIKNLPQKDYELVMRTLTDWLAY